MRLSDLRKVTVKQNLRIRFSLANGLECVLNEHGIAQLPELRAVPRFNLEEEFTRVQEFWVEPAIIGGKDKTKAKPRRYSRDEIATLAAAGPGAEAAHDEHED